MQREITFTKKKKKKGNRGSLSLQYENILNIIPYLPVPFLTKVSMDISASLQYSVIELFYSSSWKKTWQIEQKISSHKKRWILCQSSRLQGMLRVGQRESKGLTGRSLQAWPA